MSYVPPPGPKPRLAMGCIPPPLPKRPEHGPEKEPLRPPFQTKAQGWFLSLGILTLFGVTLALIFGTATAPLPERPEPRLRLLRLTVDGQTMTLPIYIAGTNVSLTLDPPPAD